MIGNPQHSIVWVGSSLKDLRNLPREIQKEIGFALWRAQEGKKYHRAKPLKGLPGVMEIVSDYMTDTYRAVYALKLGDAIYVLHVFQKKSKRGATILREEMNLIKKRLQDAMQLAEENR